MTGVSPTTSSHRKTRSSHDGLGRWAKITECPDLVAHRFMCRTVRSAHSSTAVSCPPSVRTALHSIGCWFTLVGS